MQYFKKNSTHITTVVMLFCLITYHLTFLRIINIFKFHLDASIIPTINAIQYVSHIVITLIILLTIYLRPKSQAQKPQKNANSSIANLAKEAPLPMLKIDSQGVILTHNEASNILLSHWALEKKQLPNKLMEKVSQAQQTQIPQNHTESIGKQEFVLYIHPHGQHVNIYGRNVTQENQTDNMKSEFVSLASHQLRTPLTAARWLIERLLKTTTGTLNPKQQELLSHLREANVRLIHMVNDLLNISRIEAGRMAVQPKETSIRTIFENLMKEYKHMLKNKSQKVVLTITTLVPQNINIDALLFEEVMNSLVSNAHKYSPRKSKIEIKMTRNERDYLCTIKDQGCGIPDHEQSKIFGRFFRASNVLSQDIEGTGLGLYLVKMIISSWGGTITFESTPTGTTFLFTIPREGMKSRTGDVTITN